MCAETSSHFPKEGERRIQAAKMIKSDSQDVAASVYHKRIYLKSLIAWHGILLLLIFCGISAWCFNDHRRRGQWQHLDDEREHGYVVAALVGFIYLLVLLIDYLMKYWPCRVKLTCLYLSFILVFHTIASAFILDVDLCLSSLSLSLLSVTVSLLLLSAGDHEESFFASVLTLDDMLVKDI